MLPNLRSAAVSLLLVAVACSDRTVSGPTAAPPRMAIEELETSAERFAFTGAHAGTFYATGEGVYDASGSLRLSRAVVGRAQFARVVEEGRWLTALNRARPLPAASGARGPMLSIIKVPVRISADLTCTQIDDHYLESEANMNLYYTAYLAMASNPPGGGQTLAMMDMWDNYEEARDSWDMWDAAGHAAGCYD